MDEDDVRRLHIAVDEPVLVQVLERLAERDADFQTVRRGEASAARVHLAAQGPRHVGGRVDVLGGALVVAQLHDVVEIAVGVVAADVEDIDLRIVHARDGLELADALELALVRARAVEARAPDDLHRAPCAHHVARKPDFPIGPLSDPAQQRVIGDLRGLGKDGVWGHRAVRDRCATIPSTVTRNFSLNPGRRVHGTHGSHGNEEDRTGRLTWPLREPFGPSHFRVFPCIPWTSIPLQRCSISRSARFKRAPTRYFAQYTELGRTPSRSATCSAGDSFMTWRWNIWN